LHAAWILAPYALLPSCADMVLDVEKMRKLGELVARRKAALADVGTSTPVGPPLATTSASPLLN